MSEQKKLTKQNNILWIIVAVVVIAFCAYSFLTSDLEHIEDTNGPDNYNLQVINDFDIIAGDMGMTGGISIKKDLVGDGITISGGEALCQVDFVVEVFKRMKEKGVHTALDTSGFAQWDTVVKTMPYTDLYLYDIKHMDSEKHNAVVKVPNEQILANAKLLAENGKKLQIRVPVIPLFNDDEENIRATAEFCRELGDAVSVVQLLPYHNLGVMKYLRISDEKAVEATPPSDEFMQKMKKIMEEYGLPVTIH